MFEYFKKAKAIEIKALEKLEQEGRLPRPHPEGRVDFIEALREKAEIDGLAIIAEYKRASPSQGRINSETSPAQAARAYARAGAAALSVLTEKSKFKGRLGFIGEAATGLPQTGRPPILRKDFIFNPLQVKATAATPASALLLIVRLTPEVEVLAGLRRAAESYGLKCVVEVFDQRDLDLARAAGAEIIQVNARDFTDLSVDLNRSLKLAEKNAGRPGEIWIAASGFSRPRELLWAREAGFTAILVCTALMKGADQASALKHLTSELKKGGGGHEPDRQNLRPDQQRRRQGLRLGRGRLAGFYFSPGQPPGADGLRGGGH